MSWNISSRFEWCCNNRFCQNHAACSHVDRRYHLMAINEKDFKLVQKENYGKSKWLMDEVEFQCTPQWYSCWHYCTLRLPYVPISKSPPAAMIPLPMPPQHTASLWIMKSSLNLPILFQHTYQCTLSPVYLFTASLKNTKNLNKLLIWLESNKRKRF